MFILISIEENVPSLNLFARLLYNRHQFLVYHLIPLETRMHSSRMRTGRSLTVCCSPLPVGCLLPWWCLLQGRCLFQGECLLRGVGEGGVCSGGGSAPGVGGCLLPGGVSAPGGGGVSQHALRQTPSPPVDRILDTRF